MLGKYGIGSWNVFDVAETLFENKIEEKLNFSFGKKFENYFNAKET